MSYAGSLKSQKIKSLKVLFSNFSPSFQWPGWLPSSHPPPALLWRLTEQERGDGTLMLCEFRTTGKPDPCRSTAVRGCGCTGGEREKLAARQSVRPDAPFGAAAAMGASQTRSDNKHQYLVEKTGCKWPKLIPQCSFCAAGTFVGDNWKRSTLTNPVVYLIIVPTFAVPGRFSHFGTFSSWCV